VLDYITHLTLFRVSAPRSGYMFRRFGGSYILQLQGDKDWLQWIMRSYRESERCRIDIGRLKGVWSVTAIKCQFNHPHRNVRTLNNYTVQKSKPIPQFENLQQLKGNWNKLAYQNTWFTINTVKQCDANKLKSVRTHAHVLPNVMRNEL
jgi:hypothetical protein